jgi:hypothetical protein
MHTYEHAYTPYTHLIYSRFSIVQNFIILTYIIIILNFLISQISITLLQFTTVTYKHLHTMGQQQFYYLIIKQIFQNLNIHSLGLKLHPNNCSCIKYIAMLW